MITAEWTLLVTIVTWGTSKVAVIEGRIGTLERTVDSDITGSWVVAQVVNDVVVIKSEIAEVQQVLRAARSANVAGSDQFYGRQRAYTEII